MTGLHQVRVVSRLTPASLCFPQVQMEYHFAEQVASGEYRLLSIPACDPDINYYDVLTAEARQAGGVTYLEITGISQRGGQRTFYFTMVKPSFFGDRKRKAEQIALLETLREDLGARLEKRGKLSYGVSVRAELSPSLQKLFLAAMHPQEGAIESFGSSGTGDRWRSGLA